MATATGCEVLPICQSKRMLTQRLEIWIRLSKSTHRTGTRISIAARHVALGDHRGAIADFTVSLDLENNDKQKSVTLSNRALSHMYMNEYTAAITDLNLAVQFNPHFVLAYQELATAHSQQGSYAAAIADYTRAISVEPEQADLYFGRAQLHESVGNYRATINDYTKAIGLGLNLLEVYLVHSMAFAMLEDITSAIADFDTPRTIAPPRTIGHITTWETPIGHSVTWRGRLTTTQLPSNWSRTMLLCTPVSAQAMDAKGDLTAAIVDYSKSIALDASQAMVYYNRGMAYSQRTEWQNAIADFNMAIQLKSDCQACAYSLRMAAYLTIADYDQAARDCDEAIRLEPSLAEAHRNCGVVQRHLGRVDAAMQSFTRYLELSPQASDRAIVEEWLSELQKSE